jgi:PAS domain S-box-containing protein
MQHELDAIPVPVACLATETGQHVAVNARYCELLGYRAADLLGRSLATFTVDGDAGRIVHALADADADSDQPFEFALELRRNEGSAVPVRAVIGAAAVDAAGRHTSTIVLIDDSHTGRRIEAIHGRYARLRAVRDLAPVGVIELDAATLRVLGANPQVEVITGYTPDELRGMRLTQLVEAADQPLMETDLRRLREGRVTVTQNRKRYRRKDGTPRWTVAVTTLVPGDQDDAPRLLKILRDVTEEQALQERLAASEARHRAIFESAAAGMVQTGLESRRILHANPAFCRMLDYADESDLVGLRYEDIIDPDEVEAAAERLARLRAGDRRANLVERRYFRRDGSFATALISTTILPATGDLPAHTITVAVDLGVRSARSPARR